MAKVKYSREDKWIQERLERLEEEAGDKVLYGIDVISLVVSAYGTDSEIYDAMVKGNAISKMVRKTMKENEDNVMSLLKCRLYNLCLSHESNMNDEMQGE